MAVAGLRFRVEGLREAEQALTALATEYGPRNARQSLSVPLRKAMAPALDDVRANTPVDTGDLQSLSRTRVGSPTREDMGRSPNVVFVARTGWFWPTSHSRWFQAVAVEFGTSQRAGTRVVQRALRDNIREITNIFSREIGPSIERAATRLHGRRARQGTAFRRR